MQFLVHNIAETTYIHIEIDIDITENTSINDTLVFLYNGRDKEFPPCTRLRCPPRSVFSPWGTVYNALHTFTMLFQEADQFLSKTCKYAVTDEQPVTTEDGKFAV